MIHIIIFYYMHYAMTFSEYLDKCIIITLSFIYSKTLTVCISGVLPTKTIN